MKRIKQNLNEIEGKLQRVESDWEDETSHAIRREIIFLKSLIEAGRKFDRDLILQLLNRDIDIYKTIFRLFLELSKDELNGRLKVSVGEGTGIKAFKKNPQAFVDFFDSMNLVSVVYSQINKIWTWNDVLIERLKAGRGSAIRGQRRGRYGETETEKIIKKVFGDKYDKNCNFTGHFSQKAKAEFAIPNKNDPAILFEVKTYGATGSKQTDVIGDVEKIIKAKKDRTVFLFVTDGITWSERRSDMRKLIRFQNDGSILKIYTLSMLDELESDLIELKYEYGL